MLAKKYAAKGLQDSLLGQNSQFNVVRAPFVQVLHDGESHWVAISTFGCGEGEVVLIDSLFRGQMTNYLKQQICLILNCSRDSIIVKAIPVQ